MESPTKSKLLTVGGLCVGIVILYLLAWRMGYFCCANGFTPDFCSLLKTGEIICAIGHLPRQDPFSFALRMAAQSGDPQPYVIYQWLAEVIFFQSYLLFSLVQIVAVSTAIYALSFIAIPLRSCARFKISQVWLFSLIGLLALSSNAHNFVRPELFTYLVTALVLCILQSMRKWHASNSDNKIRWYLVFALILLLVFEANVHIAFVVLVLLLILYSVVFCAEDLLKTKQLSGISKTLVIGTVASALSTLINPYGIGLWLHVPEIYSSLEPPAVYVVQPMTYELALKQLLSDPFWALIIFAFASIAVYILRNHKVIKWSPLRMLSILLIATSVAVIAFAFEMKRFSSIASLFIAFELTNFLALGSTFSKAMETEEFWKKKLSYLAIELAIPLFGFLSALFFVNSQTVLSMPSARNNFTPPFGAIQFLIKNYNGGRLFADNEISDMCELYLPNCAIFADTRFDGYNTSLLSDYLRILNAQDELSKMLDSYGIEWVIANPRWGIGKKLPTLTDWQTVYVDRECTVFHRTTRLKTLAAPNGH